MEIKYLVYVINFLELIAVIIAIISFDKYKNSNEKFFLYFLCYSFLIDILGAVVGDLLLKNNAWVYNTFIITSFLFYFSWYYNILKKSIFKKWVLVFSVLFILVAVYNLFLGSWATYNSMTFFVGALSLLVLTLFHFYQLLNSNEVLFVKYKLSFWISTGLLLFYMGMIPLMYLMEMEYTGINYLSYIIILLSLNVVLYGCYTIGFIWTKKNYNIF